MGCKQELHRPRGTPLSTSPLAVSAVRTSGIKEARGCPSPPAFAISPACSTSSTTCPSGISRARRNSTGHGSSSPDHAEYPFGDTWLGRIFTTAPTESEAWYKASSLACKDRVRVLRSVFAAMEPRFEAIWKNGRRRLEAFGASLGGALDSPEVSLAVGMLEDYLLSPCPSVQVHLLLSPLPAFTHGGANAPVGGTKGWTAHHLVREALTGAVLPGGCLSPVLGHETRDFQGAAERRLKAGDTRGYGLAKLTGS
jgi:hypothetical protein